MRYLVLITTLLLLCAGCQQNSSDDDEQIRKTPRNRPASWERGRYIN